MRKLIPSLLAAAMVLGGNALAADKKIVLIAGHPSHGPGDHEFRAAMKTDPAAALNKYALTTDERTALLAGDVAALHHMGVNDFLMGYLARFEVCGLTIPLYAERIRSAR